MCMLWRSSSELWWIASSRAIIMRLVSWAWAVVTPDPNPEMNVWLSSGATHIWNLHERQPASPWQAEINRLMNQQMVIMDHERRKQLYDRVQQLNAENLPLIFLATRDVLVGTRNEIGNFRPGVLEPYALWNTYHHAIKHSPFLPAHSTRPHPH